MGILQSMASPRILLVDDDPWIVRMVSAVLEKRGYQISTAPDGAAGLELAAQIQPDLIITDVMMPRMDGWTLVKNLRAQTRFAFVPVIFLTALSSDDDRIRGFRLGADDYLPKPFRFDELDLRVANVLKKHRELRQEAKPGGEDGKPGIHGALDQLGLSSLLAMLEMERKSGVLVLRRGAETGRIFVREGRVVFARMDQGTLQNAEAVYHLVTWPDGRFDFSAIEVDMEDQVQTSTTHLLMEGARLMDEHGRPRGEPPEH
ncbi:MAG TPA: response regulator [Polyangia bacterium]